MNKHLCRIRAAFLALKRKAQEQAATLWTVASVIVMGMVFVTSLSVYRAMQVSDKQQYAAPVLRHGYIQSVGQISQELTQQFTSSSAVSIPVSSASSTMTVAVGAQYSDQATEPAALPSNPHRAAPIETGSASSASQSVSASLSSSESPAPTESPASVSGVSSESSESSAKSTRPAEAFPVFDHAVFPVSKTPNWGAMHTPQEWNRTYSQMTDADFVPIPRYDLKTLTIPMASLTNPIRDANIPAITAKLFYSTRFFGTYDLDAGEYTGTHPGIDLKLARGTPVHAIGGGRVAVVTHTQRLGLHVIIEHRLKNGETYYSIYGHFDTVTVQEGQDVTPGQTIGLVGMTGNTASPHVHLQVDAGVPGERHVPYEGPPTSSVLNPITFIRNVAERE